MVDEYREVHRSIGAVVGKTGQRGEIMLARMLYYEDTARSEHARLEHLARDLGETGHIIGWIGEDEIILAGTGSDKAQSVATHQGMVFIAQRLHGLVDETGLCGSLFHRSDVRRASREQFQRYCACAGKEIKSPHALQIGHILDHIEDILLGEVGGGPRSYIGGHVEAASPVFSSDYAHDGCNNNRFNGAVSAGVPACHRRGGS